MAQPASSLSGLSLHFLPGLRWGLTVLSPAAPPPTVLTPAAPHPTPTPTPPPPCSQNPGCELQSPLSFMTFHHSHCERL